MITSSIARRLSLFLLAFAAVTVCGVLGMAYLLHTVLATARELSATARDESRASFSLVGKAANLQGVTQRLIREQDPDGIESLVQQSQSIAQDLQIAAQATVNKDDDAQVAKLLAAHEEVKNLVLVARNANAQRVFIEKSNPAFEEFLGCIRRHQAEVTHELEGKVAQANSHAFWGQAALAVLVLASSLTLAAYGWTLRRGIVQGLGRILEMMQGISEGEGDLTKRLPVAGHDELGKLAQCFNIFLDKLHNIITQVTTTAEHVATASEEISANAGQVAQGAQTQKDQVQQIALAMQEMSANVREVSGSSNHATTSAEQAANIARQGGTIVDDTLARMRDISNAVRETAQKVQGLRERSDQIGKIVGVIDEIADQTNLLALNAAIEAAHAGEQGRGFAVVADEVRKLAERTTTATREIAEMIAGVQAETRAAVERMQAGTSQVEKGLEVTGRAGESLRQIIGQAEDVGEMVRHIATAATQQSSAAEQVNANMEQIRRLAVESAQGAEQSARACEQLSSMALELQNLVSRFKLSHDARVLRPTTAGGAVVSQSLLADPVRAQAAIRTSTQPAVGHIL